MSTTTGQPRARYLFKRLGRDLDARERRANIPCVELQRILAQAGQLVRSDEAAQRERQWLAGTDGDLPSQGHLRQQTSQEVDLLDRVDDVLNVLEYEEAVLAWLRPCLQDEAAPDREIARIGDALFRQRLLACRIPPRERRGDALRQVDAAAHVGAIAERI